MTNSEGSPAAPLPGPATGPETGLFARLLLALLRLYKLVLSPHLPVACRFTPTCSVYAMEAVRRHGALRGSALTLSRLLRCRPWGGHGHDPVP